MKIVKVTLAAKSYEIRVGSGIMADAGLWLKEQGLAGKAVIITDSNVGPLYAAALGKSLAGAGFKVTVILIPAGEEQKTLAVAGLLYKKLAANYAERSTSVLALGGGVVGDLAGFVAATYMRGVPLVQLPTTLLAMVDSSVGGKTAVDHGQMKNIVGAFYQPRLVIADIDTLKTLPQKELSNGLAEVIKAAAIFDEDFFRFLEEHMGQAMAFAPDVLEEIVIRSISHKAEIVGRDEKESGERILLNYGHTVGHAVEAVSGFTLKHGQAVALGMLAENRIAVKMGMLSEGDAARIETLIRQAGLPFILPNFTEAEKEKVLEFIKHDKKVLNDRVRFVLLEGIGRSVVSDAVGPGLVKEVLFGRGKT
ncbi:MAG: 3-dehydroquinate synthase [Dehalococcoidales bacterium]|jgi:3-dehydroquinate synthase